MMTHELDVGQGPAFNGARMRAREEAAQGLGPLLATSRGVERSPTKARFGAKPRQGWRPRGQGWGRGARQCAPAVAAWSLGKAPKSATVGFRGAAPGWQGATREHASGM